MSERYELRLATDASRLNRLVDESPSNYFPQVWEWTEIQRSIGWDPRRRELLPAGSHGCALIAPAQLLIKTRGYVPEGPRARLIPCMAGSAPVVR